MMKERRRQPRRASFRTQSQFTVQVGNEDLSARLIDYSDGGFGIETRRKLEVGTHVRIKGQLLTATGARQVNAEGEIRWSSAGPNGVFLAGVMTRPGAQARASSDDGEPDFYEVLQVSPNADGDTIHRVFRGLAQRFHPDNRDTGDEAWFRTIMKAYETLSDTQRRVAYDARRPAQQQARWRIFENSEAARGIEAERRKRHGVLSALYVRRVNEPLQPAMSIQDMEQLLGCPREHLEFALWFLKENGWILRSDNGRYSITAKGVERAEELGEWRAVREDRLLEAASA